MKHIFILVVMLTLTVGRVYAQNKTTERENDAVTVLQTADGSLTNMSLFPEMMRLRLEAGGSINALAGSNVHQPARPEGNFGIMISRDLSWSFWETGLRWNWRQYNMKGFIPQYAEGVTRLDAFANTIEIPFMAGILLFENKSIQYVLKAGIYLETGLFSRGTLYSTDADGKPAQTDIGNIYRSDMGFESFRRFDVGGRLGIDVYIKDWKFGFEYTHGWRDIHTGYDRHIKNKNFSISVGYVIFKKQHDRNFVY